ncbi:MAG TPA: polysaccharide lyase family 8 super-sandwich domain-containing protein [Chryseosolibacter sp.]
MLRILLILVCPVLFLYTAAHAQDPVDTILVRADRFLRASSPPADVRELVRTLNKDDKWPDIDYGDQSPAGWSASTHLERLRSMTLAWTDKSSSWYRDDVLKDAIDRALDNWLENRYHNPNWWHNEIGVPRMMQDILVMLRNDLRGERFSQAMEVLGQHKVRGTGANLVWSADLGLHYGALAHDEKLIRRCSELISKEVRLTEAEGIQPDYSYHQHGARLQTFHYGDAFLRENVKLAWELKGTPWAFPGEKIDVLINFVLEGWQWMARGIYTVPGTVDRAVSRENVLKNADLRTVIPYLIALKPEKADVLNAFLRRQNGEGEPLAGYKHFPYSDFTAYHRPDFSFFVKTISTRTRFSESINGENLKGSLLNSGDTYFMRDGMEYFNLMPAWNWEYLPGITSFKGAKTVQQNFAGGVGNGASGLTAMHYKAEDGNKSLSVNKIWASHENVTVCLMADLTAENTGPVFTVMDQCRWRGDVAVNSPGKTLGSGVHQIKKLEWIYHSGFAYIPVYPSRAELSLQSVTGSWSSINRSGDPSAVVEKIFLPVLLHADGAPASGYAVAAVRTAKEARNLARDPAWKVVRNDRECQAVMFKDGTIMAAFGSEGSADVGDEKQLSLSRPALVLVSSGRVWVSDPTHAGGSVTVRLGDRQWVVILPADGSAREVD